MTSSTTNPKPVHLVVMCHGLWGEPKHLYTLEALLEQSFGSRATVARAPKKSSTTASVDSSRQNAKKNVQKQQPQAKEDPKVKAFASSSVAASSTSSVDVIEETLGQDVDRTRTLQKIEHPMKRFSKSEEEFLVPYAPAKRHASQSDAGKEMDVVILNTSSNEGSKTYDGIDWLAERVAREIKDEQGLLAEQGKYIARFSMMGYSLGGLVVRCVIGILEADRFFSPSSSQASEDGSRRPGIEARQVVTIACPHIGSPQGAGTFGRLVKTIGSRLLSRTGEQLYGMDSGWESSKDTEAGRKVGLLECMARPDSVFLRGLRRFQSVTFYANAVNDVTVPFRTGCIEEWDPFVEMEGHVDVKLIEDAPLITNIAIGKVPPKTLMETVRSGFIGVPAFMNPNRLPFGFPYNYILVIGSPILLPIGIIRIVHRLSRDSRRSRLRIKDLEHDTESYSSSSSSSSAASEEEGQQQQAEAVKGRGRIARLVRSAVGDDVEQGKTIDPTTDEHAELAIKPELMAATTSVQREKSSRTSSQQQQQHNKGFQRSAWLHKSDDVEDDDTPKPRKQPPLSEAQKTMVRNLNNPEVLPQLTKIWAYFPDLINAHGTIIARTLSMAPQRLGLPIVKHVIDNFLE